MRVKYIHTLKVGPKTVIATVSFLVAFASAIFGGAMIYGGILHEIKDTQRNIYSTDKRVEKIDDKVSVLIQNDAARMVMTKENSEKLNDVKSQQQYLIDMIIKKKIASQDWQFRSHSQPASY